VRLIFSEKALKDLQEIHHYSKSQWSELQADKYYFDLVQSCRHLCSFPKLGKKYDKLRIKPLGLKVFKHVIFYSTDAQNIYIIRVLHESRDLKKVF
jgi:toxin ParE1/3/4